jgi:F-type H+-transporting ATPase subunit a
MLHISLAAEKIGEILGFPVTNSLLMSWIALTILIIIAITVNRKLKEIPRGLQNFVEWVFEKFLNLIQGVTGNAKETYKFFPIVVTLFIFIMLSNYLGLLPGVGSIGFWEEVESHGERVEVLVPLFRAANADLNGTLAWAIISVACAQILGIAALGFFKYVGKFLPFNKLFKLKKGFLPIPSFQGVIAFFIGILELVSEIAKVISFSFRLFGNVFAGEVLLMVIGFLLAYIAPLPFYVLELFVGFIQALVFSMLTLVFLKMAVTLHEEH